MKYSELLAALHKGDRRGAYLFCGPESLLRDQALAELKSRMAAELGGSVDHDRFQGGEGPASAVTTAFTTVGLFSSQRLVTVQTPEKWGRAAKADRDDLFRTLERGSGGSVFVAISELPPREFERKNEFAKGLMRVCQVVEFWHPRPADAMRWLLSESKRRSLRLQADAGELLLEKVGPNLQELSRELEKLELWAEPEQSIDAAKLRELIQRGHLGSGWEFVDATVAGRASQALRQWDSIRVSEPVPRLLWLMQQRAREGLSQGRGSTTALQGLALRSYALERAIKTGEVNSASERLALEALVAASGGRRS